MNLLSSPLMTRFNSFLSRSQSLVHLQRISGGRFGRGPNAEPSFPREEARGAFWSVALLVLCLELAPTAVRANGANNAPSLNSAANVYLAPVTQNASAPSGAVGTSITTLVDFADDNAGLHNNVTDPDAGALLGIAITGAETSNGTWHYSINDGSTWSALGAVSDSSARLLLADANTRIYFQPTASFIGTVATVLTFRAWDKTLGSNGGTEGTTSNGGSTAFSTGTDTASITVQEANAAPVLANIETSALPYAENAAATSITATLTVADSDDANLISATVEITSNYVRGEDALEFLDTTTIHGSFDWVGGKLVLTGTDTKANYETALKAVKYRNLSDAPSTATRTVSFTVNDGSGVNNLSTPGSGVSTPVTRNIAITSANDAPSITATADQSIKEDTSTGEIVFVVSDPESDAAATLYDNTLNSRTPGVVFPGNGIEFGDQVRLSGVDRLAVDFQFGVYLAGGATGAEKAELFIRRNDGVNNSPRSLLFQSGEFTLSPGVNLLSIPGFSLTLPDTFTWSVVFSGVTTTAGLLIYDPPSVGASLGDFWQKNPDDTWSTHLVSSGSVDANFAARIAKASGLTVTAVSRSIDQALVPNSNIVVRDLGSTRTVTVTPVANASGVAEIMLSVSDGSSTTTDMFLLTVLPVNDAPIRTGTVANLVVAEDSVATSLGLAGLTYSPGPADEVAASQTLTYKVTAVPPSTLGQVKLANGTVVAASASLLTPWLTCRE